MKRAIHWSAIAVVGLGMVSAGASFAADSGVTVLRGTPTQTAETKASAGEHIVLRGMPAERSQSAESRKSRSRQVASGWISTGGEALWLVERRGGTIVGCWLQGSTYAGRSEIRCARTRWR